MVQLDLQQVRELLTSLNQTDISELTLKGEDFELTVRRGAGSPPAMVVASPGVAVSGLPPSNEAGAVASSAPVAVAIASPAVSTPAAAPPLAAQIGFAEIKSPMVGTFYRAPAPGEPAFVNPGDRIGVGQTVCIIEAMKLMNEIESEIAGEVVEILVQNGQPIEFDQPLVRVRLDA